MIRYESQNFKMLLLPQFWSDFNQAMINMIVMGNIGYYFFGGLTKIKNLWHFEIFFNTEPYGAGNFKTLLLHFSSDVSQTL